MKLVLSLFTLFLSIHSFASTPILSCSTRFETLNIVESTEGTVDIDSSYLANRVRSNPYIRGTHFVEAEAQFFVTNVERKGDSVVLTLDDEESVTIFVNDEYVEIKFSNEDIKNTFDALGLVNDDSGFLGFAEECILNF